jgi:hypothetical protein
VTVQHPKRAVRDMWRGGLPGILEMSSSMSSLATLHNHDGLDEHVSLVLGPEGRRRRLESATQIIEHENP